MIIGIGSDLLDIRRLERTLSRHAERFIERVFTDVERQRAESRKDRIASYAKRFAAKEACARALGTGIAKGVFWRDMSVVNKPDGCPVMELSGGAARRLSDMMPEGHEGVVHLSITDDYPMAQAFVVIEARRTAS